MAAPESPLAPLTSAVYIPGGREAMMAASLLPALRGKAPTPAVTATMFGLEALDQELLVASWAPFWTRVRTGSGRIPLTPNFARVGPTARIRTFSFVVPPITNP